MRVERFLYVPLRYAHGLPDYIFQEAFHRRQENDYYCQMDVVIDGQKLCCRELFPDYIPEYEARRKMENSIMKEINGKLFGRS